MILDRLAEELNELAVIEQRPNLDGRNMTMLLGPSKAVLAGTLGKDGGNGAEPAAADADAPAEAAVSAEAAAPAEADAPAEAAAPAEPPQPAAVPEDESAA
jgi:translation initiation factor IF-3